MLTHIGGEVKGQVLKIDQERYPIFGPAWAASKTGHFYFGPII